MDELEYIFIRHFFFSFSVSVLSHFDALAAPGVPVSYYVYSLNI